MLYGGFSIAVNELNYIQEWLIVEKFERATRWPWKRRITFENFLEIDYVYEIFDRLFLGFRCYARRARFIVNYEHDEIFFCFEEIVRRLRGFFCRFKHFESLIK